MDRIAIVSAVRDFAFYRKCVEENPMLDGCEKTVFDNRTENMPLPARYNEFLDSFDYSRPAWIVFCHEDWEATEPVAPVLSRLDPGSVYGVAGATVERRAFFFARWKFIGDIESCNRDGSDPGVHGLPAPPGTACDTVDCVCLVVHSSLVQRHSLRFDPEMTFDLYAEDFCILVLLKRLDVRFDVNLVPAELELSSHFLVGTYVKLCDVDVLYYL